MLKFINGRNRQLSQLAEIVEYVKNPDKNSHGLYAGAGVRVTHAAEDMKTVKVLKNKTTGRQYIHFVVSFDRGVAALTAHAVGMRILDYYGQNFQIIMAVHDNTENVHCHFVLNTVGLGTRKFSQSKREMLDFREFINGVLDEWNLRAIAPEITEISFEEMDEADSIFCKQDEHGCVNSCFYANAPYDGDQSSYFNDEEEFEVVHSATLEDTYGEDFDSEGMPELPCMENAPEDRDYWGFPQESDYVPQPQPEMREVMSHVSEEECQSPKGRAYARKMALDAEAEIQRLKAERDLRECGSYKPLYYSKVFD